MPSVSFLARKFLLAQLTTQYLADIRSGQIIDKYNVLGHLVGSQVFAAIGFQVFTGQHIIPTYHKQLDSLPTLLAGNTDNRAFRNSRVRVDDLFHLTGNTLKPDTIIMSFLRSTILI